jgi:hypothetical protein
MKKVGNTSNMDLQTYLIIKKGSKAERMLG